jgi:tetratricopeptide (TPR) repeat protein
LPATIPDKGFEHSIRQNELDANSTAWRTSFETGDHVVEKSEQIISGELQAANRYHGLDHPAVVIDLPTLECECKFPHGASTLEGMEKGDVEKAIQTGEAYLKQNDALHKKETMQFLASIYFNKGDFAKSVELYEKALAMGIVLEPEKGWGALKAF